MKSIFTLTLSVLLAAIMPLSVFSQLNNGGLYANFGVDADTRSNYMKYGLVTGAVASDDWFAPALSGYNVIDTSNAATYLSLLQAGANIGFNKRMSQLLYAKINGKLWLDAAYGRDYVAASSDKDTTVFTSVNKNGDNPSVWTGGVTSVPTKNDLVDVYAHMRRDGTNVHDSLWFFTGVGVYGTNGASYYDVELYKNSFTYNSASGTFTTAGPDYGHTQWLFDASGNITQTGDLIVSVTCSPSSVPVIDVRIWVSLVTYNTLYGGALSPSHFNFNGNYSSSGGSLYGYASIVSKTGTTAFGAGLPNSTATSTAAQDTTYSTPWGTSVSGTGWISQYQTQQLTEVGLNLTRIGVDPALYAALSPCQSLFSNIFFKSRSSASFTSNMQDFVTPLTFLRSPVMDYSLKADTLRCNHTTGAITITNNTTAGYYTWQTANGSITGTNSDSSQLSINKPGTYIVSSSPAAGCPTTRKDTVVIPIDTFPPVASLSISMIGSSYLQLYGGNVSASNYSTPFGGSQGLLWNWTGPKSFSSTIQNPSTTDTAWGTYHLTVTEKRNGCTATASQTVSVYDFSVLMTQNLQLNGVYDNNSIVLTWSDLNQNDIQTYVIEKYTENKEFTAIGAVSNEAGMGQSRFSATDYHPLAGNNTYRINAVSNTGQSYYSGVITIVANAAGPQSFYLTRNASSGSGLTLMATANNEAQGVIAVYSISGQTLARKTVHLVNGVNSLEVPSLNGRLTGIQVISLFINGQGVWSQKAIF